MNVLVNNQKVMFSDYVDEVDLNIVQFMQWLQTWLDYISLIRVYFVFFPVLPSSWGLRPAAWPPGTSTVCWVDSAVSS